MIALDTNVLVRIVTRDDPEQAERAATVFEEADSLWIAKTVFLELEWILRHTYGLPASTIGDTFQKILGYRKVQVEDRAALLQALSGYSCGLDFADALHLASSPEAHRLFTFDRKLAKTARDLDTLPPVELL